MQHQLITGYGSGKEFIGVIIRKTHNDTVMYGLLNGMKEAAWSTQVINIVPEQYHSLMRGKANCWHIHSTEYKKANQTQIQQWKKAFPELSRLITSDIKTCR